MPILSNDIKLLAAERLLDTPDGGGRMTGHVVVDGASNNLFADISELDRTYGRVSLRKTFVGVLTDSTESYYGAHAIVAQAPADPNVSVTLFTTGSWTDRREAARDRIERYLARGVKWPGQLLERQLTGQRAIALLLKPTDPLPRVGQALVLVQDEAKATEVEQYVRVTRITTANRSFTVSDGSGNLTFAAVVATCEISDPLRYDFDGQQPSNRDDLPGRTVVRDTVVANAAVYYGMAPLAVAGRIGELAVQVTNLFGQLVPSAQSETPLVDMAAASMMAPLQESGNGALNVPLFAVIGAGRSLYLGNPAVPGSVRVMGAGYTFEDAAGEIKSGGAVIGSIDYTQGKLVFKDGTPGFSGGVQVSFRPAGVPSRVADTAAITVTAESRGYIYTITLCPPPQPGAVSVSYMAQGKWYTLTDRGDGSIRGSDSSFGAATVDYVSGTLTLTTGALPDANSAILFAWGSGASYFNRAKNAVAGALVPAFSCTLAHPGVVPGSLTLRWTDGNRDLVAHDDGHGTLAGDAAGTVSYAQGTVVFAPRTLPAGGAEFSITYEWGPPQETLFEHPLRDADGNLTLRLPQPDIRPGTVELEFNLLIEHYEAISETPAELQIPQRTDPVKIVHDSAGGGFDGGIAGSVDYASGTLRFRPDTTTSVPLARYSVVPLGRIGWKLYYRNTFLRWDYVIAGAAMPTDESGYVKVRYRAADSPNTATEVLALDRLVLDLTRRAGGGYAERIVPGSVRFVLGGKTYIDRQGSLIVDMDANTGAGTLAGSIDYASGRVQLTVWQPGASASGTIQSLLTELGGLPVDELCFRVPAAPVRPGSLQLRATALTGEARSATASADGTIAADGLLGTVDYETGVARVRFGRMVAAAGRENEIWYKAEAVENGQIFQPLPVYADTLRFNAVAYTYLPLSAQVLGLDPVRLPVDGRVPIFRPGDVAVVHHTARTPFPKPASAGYTLDMGRVRLAALRVLDAQGAEIPADRYAASLDAGTVTLKAPLNLAGFTEPLVAEHRVEDMALISDTQINGVLTLTRPLTHAYPAGEARVSSALIIGDLQSRAHTLFAQQTWTGEWADARIGANTIAQYNETVYPLEVTNRGAIEERWALIFTNTTEFRVVGESVGQIAVGNTAADCTPINPETHAPYFTLHAAGWGAGWSAGNVLRFATAGANFPLWIARTVLQGPATQDSDAFQIQIRGDVDRQ